MNYCKLQTEILKALDKDKMINGRFPYMYGFYEKLSEKFVIITDGYVLHLVPEEKFYLNLDKCFKTPPLTGIDKMIKGSDEAVDTYTEGLIKPVEKNKVQIFNNRIDDIWIDVNNLKLFDLKNSTFKGSDKKSPLYIYEGEELVVFGLPVNHK